MIPGFDADAMAAWWAALPVGAAVAAKATAVLAMAWALAAALRGRDPRARVLAWRASAVGLAVGSGLALAPPAVGWRPDLPTPPTAAATTPTDGEPIAGPAFVPHATETASAATLPASGLEVGVGRPAPAAVARSSIRRGQLLLAAWLAGVGVALLRWGVGLVRLVAIVRRSEAVPEAVAAEARALAERLGVRRPVRVVRSGAVAVPCLAGVPGPVVLLPDGPGWPDDPRDRRAILAHELAHARGRDLGWNHAFHLIGALLWFHPLAWRLRSAHAAACDAAADATAAGLLGDARVYAGTLARLALAASKAILPPAAGLAMARRADVRRRIDALLSLKAPSPPSRRSAMLAPLAVGLLAALLGTAGVLPAAQDPPPVPQGPAPALPDAPVPLPADPLPTPFPAAAQAAPVAPAGRLVIHAVDATTNQPLAGVEVSSSDIVGGVYRGSKVVATDPAGAATVAYEPPIGMMVFDLTLRKPGYVPESMRFSGRERPVLIPPSIDFRLEPGRTLGGVVVDDAGRPVAGAAVRLSKPLARSEMRGTSFQFASPTTDAAGRWEIREAPADLNGVRYAIRHPGYLPTLGEVAGGPEVRSVLVRGVTVRGTVVDVDGTPIRGARVVLGRGLADVQVTSATADAAGGFELLGCPVGPTLATVQQDSFAPQVREVRVEPGDATPPVDFRLEPGSTLRIRVVDPAGRPIPGATCAVDSYRGSRSLSHREKADADGRIVWRGGAPPDAIDLGIYAAGHQRRDVFLTAGPEEQVVTLAPELVVSGRVNDARTGAAIPEFAITAGFTPASWTTGSGPIPWPADRPRPTAWEARATAYRDGRYARRLDFVTAHECFLRIEAPGYRVAESRGYRPDEGPQAWDVALEPEAWPAGVVVGPDGQGRRRRRGRGRPPGEAGWFRVAARGGVRRRLRPLDPPGRRRRPVLVPARPGRRRGLRRVARRARAGVGRRAPRVGPAGPPPLGPGRGPGPGRRPARAGGHRDDPVDVPGTRGHRLRHGRRRHPGRPPTGGSPSTTSSRARSWSPVLSGSRASSGARSSTSSGPPRSRSRRAGRPPSRSAAAAGPSSAGSRSTASPTTRSTGPGAGRSGSARSPTPRRGSASDMPPGRPPSSRPCSTPRAGSASRTSRRAATASNWTSPGRPPSPPNPMEASARVGTATLDFTVPEGEAADPVDLGDIPARPAPDFPPPPRP